MPLPHCPGHACVKVHSVLPNLRRVGLMALAYFLTAQVGMASIVKPENLATLWPSSGLMLACFVLEYRRARGLTILTAFVANLLVNLFGGHTWPVSLGFAVANTAEIGLAGWLLVRGLGTPVTLTSLRQVVGFVGLAVMAGSGSAALLGAAVPSLAFGAAYWDVWRQWWIADGVGMLMVAPVLLAWAAEGNVLRATLTRRQWLAGLVLCVLLLGLSQQIFGTVPTSGSLSVSLVYMPLLLLFWAAWRFGAAGAATTTLLLAIVAVHHTAHGAGPFTALGQTAAQRIPEVQLYLSVASCAALLVAALVRERQQVEGALRESEGQLRLLLMSTAEAIYGIDRDGVCTFCNDACVRLLGYQEPGDLIGKPMHAMIHHARPDGTPLPVDQCHIHQALQQGKAMHSVDEVLWRADGQSFPVERWIYPLYRGPEIVGAVVTFLDITERQRMAAALDHERQLLQAIMAHIEVGVLACDAAGNLTFSNRALQEVHGQLMPSVAPERWTNQYDLYWADSLTPLKAEEVPLYRALHGALVHNVEVLIKRPDTEARLMLVSGQPMRDSQGRPLGAVIVTHDITERKRAEKQLRAALTEKEVLLQEIHHRVKNNMQVISSLLQLQTRYITDPQARTVFQESQHRIRAMGMIHEQLYQSTSLAHIDAANYFQSLTAMLGRSYNAHAAGITLTTQIGTVALSMDTAIPLGLITTELVSNSLKHAFPHGQEGRVTVTLQPTPTQHYTLCVEDTGVGLPAHVTLAQATTLGLRMVNLLTKQLGGHAKFQSSPEGTECRVTFCEPAMSHRPSALP